jgi:hypothetical protein
MSIVELMYSVIFKKNTEQSESALQNSEAQYSAVRCLIQAIEAADLIE